MKILKRLVAVVMVFIVALFSSALNVRSVFASGDDTTAPVITGLTFLTSEVSAPGTVQLQVDFIEEGTGVCSGYGSVNYKETMGNGGGENTRANFSFGEWNGDYSFTKTTGSFVIDIPISANVLSGEWALSDIALKDHAGNETYINWSYEWNQESEKNEYVYVQNNEKINFNISSFNITGGTKDTTAPVITGLNFLTSEVSAPGTVQLQVDFIEEGTGVCSGYGNVNYKETMGNGGGENTRANFSFGEWNGDYSFTKTTGSFVIDIPISANVLSGEWALSDIALKDHAGNETYINWSYEWNQETEKNEYVYVQNNEKINFDISSFIITGGVVDTTAPVINNIKVKKDFVYRPGVLQLQVDFTEEETGVCSGYGSVNYKETMRNGGGENTRANFSFGEWNGDYSFTRMSGSLIVNIPISTNALRGEWTLGSITLKDHAGNETYINWSYEWNQETEENEIIYVQNNEKVDFDIPTFEVLDEFDVDFEVSLSNLELANKLEAMEEGKTAKVLIDNASNAIMKSEIFEAIRGKNKTIVLYTKNGYQWIFNGMDITEEVKDIDLSLLVRSRSADDFESDEDVVEVLFAENGVLPGKAQIRMKSDYLYNLYDIKGVLYLYHEDGDTLTREDNACFDLVFDGTDKWCYFDVYHNSGYIISANSDLKKYVPLVTKEDNTTPVSEAVVTTTDVLVTSENVSGSQKVAKSPHTEDSMDLWFVALFASVIGEGAIMWKRKKNVVK